MPCVNLFSLRLVLPICPFCPSNIAADHLSSDPVCPFCRGTMEGKVWASKQLSTLPGQLSLCEVPRLVLWGPASRSWQGQLVLQS